MADSSIPVTGGAGYNVDTRTTTGGEHREVVVLGDSNSDNSAKVNPGGDQVVSLTAPTIAALGMYAAPTPYGRLQVAHEPSTVFRDGFEPGALDTANRWNTIGTVPTITSGGLLVAPGTTNSVTSGVASQVAFPPAGLGFSILGSVVTLETAQVANPNVHRFWGLGQVNSYSAATPLTDGAGFEVDATGALNCVVYVNGTRYVINSTAAANISSSVAGAGGSGTAVPSGAVVSNYGGTLTWPAGTKRFALYFRPDVMYWFIDDSTKPVGVATYLTPNSSTLPVRIAAANTAAGTVSAATTFNVISIGLGDTVVGNHTVSDGTYPWRRASVGKTGGLAVRGAPMTSTSAAIAAGTTGTIGPLDVSEAGNLTVVVKSTAPAAAWAGAPVMVFEQSDDSVSWGVMPVIRADTGQVAATHVLPAGTVNGEIIFNVALPGVNYVRVRVTTGPTTNGLTVVLSPGGLAFQPVVSTQNALRTPFVFYTAGPLALTATDALVSLTGTRNGVAVTAATSPAVVAAGRTMRITNFNMTFIATATSGYGIARLRANAAGAVVVGSPVYRTLAAGASTPTTANSSGPASVSPMADGLEFNAGTGIGVSVQGMAAAAGAAAGYVILEVSGYEY